MIESNQNGAFCALTHACIRSSEAASIGGKGEDNKYYSPLNGYDGFPSQKIQNRSSRTLQDTQCVRLNVVHGELSAKCFKDKVDKIQERQACNEMLNTVKTYNGQTVNIPQITTYFASPDGTHLLAPLKNSYPKCDLLLKYHKGIPTLVTEVPKCNPNTGGGFNINGDTLALYPMNVGQSQPSPSLLHILTLNEEGYWVKANIFEVERKIRSIAFSPDDRRMAVAHGDKISVYGRDANNEWVFNASVTVEPRSPCHWQTSIDFLPDSGSIEVLSQSDLNIDKDNVNYCCSTVTISPIASVFRS